MTDLELLRAFNWFLIADGLLLIGCVLVGLLLHWILRRIDPLPSTVGRPWTRKIGQGAVIAVAAIALTVGPAAVAGGYRAGNGWQAFPPTGDSLGPIGMWLALGVHALMEELIYRGVAMALLASVLLVLVRLVLKRLGKDEAIGPLQWSWLWTGLVVNLGIAIVFGFAHADNPNATPIAVVNIALASLMLGQIMWNQASILGAWMVHWVWNGLIVTLGFPVSGVRLPRPFADLGVTGARDGPLTGGQFGPEGSLLCTVVLSLFFLLLVFEAIRAVRQAARVERDVVDSRQ